MPDSTKTDTNSAAKPKTKSAHKRRKASINFNPSNSRKKRAVACNSNSDNVDHTEILMDFNVKEKSKRNEENEESSKLSEADKESSKTNQTIQISQISHTKTPATTQSNTSSTVLSTQSSVPSTSKQLNIMSPDLPEGLREGDYRESEDIQTDKNFLQQQIQFFATAFTLQDCPSLAGKQDRRKNSIPHDVIQDALRKLHHKMDDEIQKHLNRQCQRKVLSELLQIEKDKSVCDTEDEQRKRKNHIAETMDISEILGKCSKELDNSEGTDDNLLMRRYSNSVDELQRLNDEMKKIKQKIASYESNNLMILEVECLARETTENSLRREVERTSKLVNEILRRKANST